MDPTSKRNLVKERQILKDLDGSHPEENYGWEISGREQTTRDDQTSPPPTTTTTTTTRTRTRTTRTTLTVLGPDGFAAGKKGGHISWNHSEIWSTLQLSHQESITFIFCSSWESLPQVIEQSLFLFSYLYFGQSRGFFFAGSVRESDDSSPSSSSSSEKEESSWENEKEKRQELSPYQDEKTRPKVWYDFFLSLWYNFSVSREIDTNYQNISSPRSIQGEKNWCKTAFFSPVLFKGVVDSAIYIVCTCMYFSLDFEKHIRK